MRRKKGAEPKGEAPEVSIERTLTALAQSEMCSCCNTYPAREGYAKAFCELCIKNLHYCEDGVHCWDTDLARTSLAFLARRAK